MIEEKYDVHQEWAQKIARADKDFAKLLKAEPGKARHRAKNEWVFPAFYGSSLNSIIRNLELQKDAAEKLFDEFWSTFQGVKSWQKRQWSKYQRDLYVESLSGRRRYGPLSWNMTINTPIQSEASDICVDGMIRLFDQSIELDTPWLCPVLQIHDDLTFLIPKKKLDDATEIVVKTCLAYDRPWVNVPLMVEAETGPDLFNMKSIGEFSPDDF